MANISSDFIKLKNMPAKLIEMAANRRKFWRFDQLALTDDEAAERRSAHPGEIERQFFENQGRLAHKWIHYLPIYDHIFAPYRLKPITMLEIGVSFGGSLKLWREYFGPEATLFGVDINPECARRVDPPNQVRIGSQGDPAFLNSVVAEMGAPDIILDDGSHISTHQRVSFRTLWPHLKVGGLYVMEDVHTAYWPRLEGGYRRRGTAIEFGKQLIDDQHGWYHGRRFSYVDPSEVGAITFHDSIIVIEKEKRLRPGHYKTGRDRGPAPR